MITIDVRGKPCPLPVVEAKNALRQAAPGETIQLLVDNDIARQNLQKLAEGAGATFAWEAVGSEDGGNNTAGHAGDILVSITVPTVNVGGVTASSGTVVTISADTMGRGNDELGAVLMKTFLYSLAQLDAPPAAIFFYNSGVRLTCEGSPALTELQALKQAGVDIESCGTCLDFYHLREKLAVGGITNMFMIADTLTKAVRIVNPG
jgi:selenium metabolism protein YedF